MADETVQQLAHFLRETTAADASRIAAAEARLRAASDAPGFGAALLVLVAHASDPNPETSAVAVPAAAFLRNFARTRWPNQLVPGERETLRVAVLRALVVAPTKGPVLKLLAETFRIIVTEDVTRAKCWPDLLPDLCAAMQESNLMNGKSRSPIKTANALVAVHVLLKPYKYFQNPGMEKESAPPELEAIVKALLEPLLGMLDVLAAATLRDAAAERGDAEAVALRDAELARREQATDPAAAAAANDEMLHVLLKCFHHTVASYMPNALVPTLPRWLDVLAKLLERAPEFDASDASDDAARGSPRAKTVKRALQALVSLVTRHRRHVDKALRGVCSLTARLAGALARARLGATEEAPLSATASRQCALCFDLLARVAETAPGFKLLGEGATFGSLLETAVFPALCAAPVDEVEFVEDEEEYLRANLPTDSDDPTGFNEELYAPRQSAANLLALLAERGGGGGGGGGKNDKEVVERGVVQAEERRRGVARGREARRGERPVRRAGGRRASVPRAVRGAAARIRRRRRVLLGECSGGGGGEVIVPRRARRVRRAGAVVGEAAR